MDHRVSSLRAKGSSLTIKQRAGCVLVEVAIGIVPIALSSTDVAEVGSTTTGHMVTAFSLLDSVLALRTLPETHASNEIICALVGVSIGLAPFLILVAGLIRMPGYLTRHACRERTTDIETLLLLELYGIVAMVVGSDCKYQGHIKRV